MTIVVDAVFKKIETALSFVCLFVLFYFKDLPSVISLCGLYWGIIFIYFPIRGNIWITYSLDEVNIPDCGYQV